MAPRSKQPTPSPQPAQTASTPASTPAPTPSKSRSTPPPSASISTVQDAQDIVQSVWTNYLDKTPQRVKLLDAFMAFLIAVGLLQFVYCVIGGNYPFNAFLAGFSATVGQFVLTASLRIQTNPDNKADFKSISHERAFADFVFGSMILHFFCVNFIN